MTIQEQAAHWVMRLNDADPGEAERQKLQDWLLADPQHEKEFRAHYAPVALARDLPPDLQARLSAFAPPSRDERSGLFARPWMRLRYVGLAATLLVALAAGSWLFWGQSPFLGQTYVTHTDEMRTVTFEDGSVAYLNTRTRLKWVGNSHDRRVRLVEGEALFDVANDPDRPFRVVLDNSEIRVLGTRFNVYRKPDGETTVTVLEGAVDVHGLAPGEREPAWERRLEANQQIVYRPLGLMGDIHETNAGKAIRWREGIMEIENQPLPTVLEELMRYTDQHIVVRDPIVNRIHVGGVLNVRDIQVALARLQKLAPVKITQSGDTFTLAYQTQSH